VTSVPSITAVLVNFGPPDDSLTCVRSLEDTQYPVLRIIVVDNGSAPDARNRLQRDLRDRVELILSDRNLGFSGGNNLGIQRALEQGTDYVLLINNDAALKPDALQVLAAAAPKEPGLGIMAGKILVSSDAGPTSEVWSAGGQWHPLKATAYATGMGEPDRGQYDRSGETEFVPGCLWFVPADVFRRAGLLDEAFFLYIEDADYCLRLRRAGYRLVYEPRAVCYHKVSRSHWHDRERASPTLNYYTNRNRFLIARRWLTPVQRMFFYPYMFASRLLQAGRHLDLSYLRGLWDGVRGKTGPLSAR
jgi:GT2 family glycosyltransferase